MLKETPSNCCAHAGCLEPGIYSTAGGHGALRHFCGEHLWDKSPLTDHEHTCDMFGANPPATDRCGLPATVKWTNALDGRTLHWCERCRRKHFPTEAEKEEDARREVESARTNELWDKFVFTPIWWAIQLGLLALALYGVIAFIHWCWRNT